VTDLGSALGLAIAFAGGVVSFASPCCLPMIPAYVGYMVGTAGAAGTAHRRRTAFLHGLAFVAGFSVVFVAFWASIGAVGYVFADNVGLLRMLGGALLIFLGLHVARVIDIPVLWRDLRPMAAMSGAGTALAPVGGGLSLGDRPSYARSALFGTFFAAGWSPCIGPILGAIIGLASVSASVAQGTLLLVAYAAGLAVPFLAVALGADWVAQRLRVVGRHELAVARITGLALVVVGSLMVTGLLSKLAAVAPFGL
jgi:cytochrome c-type biogenesis protein